MTYSRIFCFALSLCAAVTVNCSGGPDSARRSLDRAMVDAALGSLSADSLLQHINVLASDRFEGRAPGTTGEDLTVDYLVRQFQAAGLKPGNPDGTFVQKVPLVGFKAKPTAWFTVGSAKIGLRFPDDYVAVSRHQRPEVRVEDSDLVFVGYGVLAPEYGWDDYKGVDVRGKTVVMLINDPPVPDPADASRLDEKMFKGKAMTYYGRWTYKYEIASRKGAAAAILVHETGPAGYPYQVVQGSWARENFDVKSPESNRERVAVESWITSDAARRLFAAAGQDFDRLKQSAVRSSFRPVSLRARATFDLRVITREIESANVVARLDGSEAKLRDEYVVYTAHWDHLGTEDRPDGDRVFNGAVDNASGVAALLELAKAFTRLHRPPGRSILFLAVTAEEKGLLGAKYYVENPLYPLAKTAADINMDGMDPWGRTADVVVIGLGNSTLDDTLEAAVRRQNRTLKPDPDSEKGFFYRSDHFEFAKKGVPVLYTDSGTDVIGKSADYGRRKRDEYTAKDYHKVSDEVRPDWDLSGVLEDVKLLFEVGCRVGDADGMPEWKPGSEFKAQRESMLRGRPASGADK